MLFFLMKEAFIISANHQSKRIRDTEVDGRMESVHPACVGLGKKKIYAHASSL